MRADYEQLRAKWVETFTKSGRLGLANQALVSNYLVNAAEHTSDVLRMQANDPESAEDAAKYARSMRTQAPVYRGWTTVATVCSALGFSSGVVVSMLRDLPKILTEAFETVGRAGAQFNSGPLIRFLFSGSVAVLVLRFLWAVLPQVGSQLKLAWNAALNSTNPAKTLISTMLDEPEKALFGALDARRPSRFKLQIAGPGLALGERPCWFLSAFLWVYLSPQASSRAQVPPASL
ncbi:MAG TPA: hypothetical protein VK638_32160 [Edaphobacter sp.]|nr:hypothetical protein [Edaphobacter sp.]